MKNVENILGIGDIISKKINWCSDCVYGLNFNKKICDCNQCMKNNYNLFTKGWCDGMEM